MLTPVTPNPIAASSIKSHSSETRTAPGHNPVSSQSQPHVASHSHGIGLDAGTILANVNAEAATAGNRTILQTLALAVAAQLDITRGDDETMEAFFFRIADAIDALPADERLAVEIRSGLKALRVQAQALAAALRQPESALAARLVAAAEAPLATPLKTAAAAATTTYLQQGNGVTRAAETLAMGTQARTNAEGNGLFSSAGMTPMADRQPGDARSLQIQLKALFEPGVAETRIEIARKVETPQILDPAAIHEPEETTGPTRQTEVTIKSATVLASSVKAETPVPAQQTDGLGQAELLLPAAQEAASVIEHAAVAEQALAADATSPADGLNLDQPDMDVDQPDIDTVDDRRMDARAVNTKPADTKPADLKFADPRHVAERPVDAKPAVERQPDPKLPQVRQADAGHTDPKSMAERHADPKQPDARQILAKPADARLPEAKPAMFGATGLNLEPARREASPVEARSADARQVAVRPDEGRAVAAKSIEARLPEIRSEPRTQAPLTPQNSNVPGVAAQLRMIAREIVQERLDSHQKAIEAKSDTRDQRVQTLLTLKGIAEAITRVTAAIAESPALPQAASEARPHKPHAGEPTAMAGIPDEQPQDIRSEMFARKDAEHGHHSTRSSTGDADDTAEMRPKAERVDQGDMKPATRAADQEAALVQKSATSLDPVPFAYAALQPVKEEFTPEAVDENDRREDDDENAGDGEPEDEDSRRERLARKATDDLLRPEPEAEPELRITRDSSQADRAYALYQRMGGF